MRSYTDEERAETLQLYIAVGPHEAARRTGIPVRNITRWATNAGVSTEATPEKIRAAVEAAKAHAEAKRALKREQLKTLLLDKAVDMLERMDAPHYQWTKGKDPVKVEFDEADSGQCKDYAIAAGVLIDKLRLESGEATGRFEHGELRGRARDTAGGSALRIVA